MGIEIKNWRWDQLRSLGTSKLVQLTFLVPILGYFILFGESYNEYLQLNFGAEPESGISYWRIYFLYFGFCSLAAASLLFAVFCPDSIKLHGSAFEYIEKESITFGEQRSMSMEAELVEHHYGRVRIDNDIPQYINLIGTLTHHSDETVTTERDDDERYRRGLESIQRIEKVLNESDKPKLMKTWFVYLEGTKPTVRAWISGFYILGFGLVAVPTAVVFVQVLYAALKNMISALATIGS